MRWFFILITAAILHACSSKPVIPAADRSITPLKAASSQPSDSSNLLQWGGVIIETRNLRETTEIQILAYPIPSMKTATPIRTPTPSVASLRNSPAISKRWNMPLAGW
ncbi:MAG: Slp family lipoprotein [Candidatus Thiodiazotropha endolucinida]